MIEALLDSRAMIDLNAARNDPDAYRAALARKGAGEAFDALLEADERWRALVPRIDELRGKTKLKGKPSPEQLAELQQVKEELRAAEEELAAAEAARDELLAAVPNPPHESVPDGTEEDDAVEIRRVGRAAGARGGARAHRGRPLRHGARGALSGSRFGYRIGDTALLALALYRAGARPPRRERLHARAAARARARGGDDRHRLLPDRALEHLRARRRRPLPRPAPSEVALAGLHMGEILPADELPLRYAGFSTNFRREAGAAGKDTRGMFRVHQFNKVEMFVYTTAPRTRGTSTSGCSRSRRRSCRSSACRTAWSTSPPGDLGAPAAKKYDIEAWFPTQERYREITSCSNTTDFQARRLGIRYRGESGIEPVHTLNGTMVTDRALLAILENFQGEVPDVLREFGAPERVDALGEAHYC